MAKHGRLEELVDYLLSDDAEREAELREDGYFDAYIDRSDDDNDDPDFDDVVEWWMGEDATALPAWAHLEYVRYEDSQWLIHVTDGQAAQLIQEHGFRGIVSVEKVATSTAFRNNKYDKTGFCFAFRLEDVIAGKVDNPTWFGQAYIIFRAPSVRIRSTFDNEEQSIFIAEEAQDIMIEDTMVDLEELVKEL